MVSPELLPSVPYSHSKARRPQGWLAATQRSICRPKCFPLLIHLSWVTSELIINPRKFAITRGCADPILPSREGGIGQTDRFLPQLKLCSVTNRWEPFTGRAGASVSPERCSTPGLAARCPHPHTRALRPGSCSPTRGWPAPAAHVLVRHPYPKPAQALWRSDKLHE